MINESITELSGGIISIPDVVVDYNSKGIISGGSIIDKSLYNVSSQGVPVPFKFTSLFIKYGSTPGNVYSGSSLNRFIITLYKNNIPTSLKLVVDNPTSSEGPIISSVSSDVYLSSDDTWALYIEPGSLPENAPSTGSNTWCIYLTQSVSK